MTRPDPVLPGRHGEFSSSQSFRLAGLALAFTASLVLGLFCLDHLAWSGNGQPSKEAGEAPSPYFRNWGKPDVAIVLTGQMHGYLQPCGCSEPQYGGLARRYNLLHSLRDKGWPVVAFDLGDLAPRPGPQSFLKFQTALEALDLMSYTGLGLGSNEFNLQLINVLGFKVNFKRDEPPHLVASNLNDSLNIVKPWVIAGVTTRPATDVAAACLIGPSVAKAIQSFPNVKLGANNKKVISDVLNALGQQRPGLVVLLYQGSEQEAKACAHYCQQLQSANPALPKINIILCLEEEEEPSGRPRWVGDTMIVGVGHKGRNLGVVGAFSRKGASGFDLKYQLVPLGPELNTPPGNPENPVMRLMEKYAQDVKKDNFVSRFPRGRHPMQLAFPEVTYVGSQRCGKCHEHAYKVWAGSKHAHAFQALVNAKHPSLRQFDGECVACHTVGFEFTTGYADPGNVPARDKILENVGCESCHGPGSAHVKNTNNQAIRALMNPYKSKAGAGQAAEMHRLNQLDKFCQKCHDIDNDVHWGKNPFQVNWTKIAHPTPANEKN